MPVIAADSAMATVRMAATIAMIAAVEKSSPYLRMIFLLKDSQGDASSAEWILSAL